MKKSASILDFSYPFLDPAVWDQDKHLFAFQRDFILRLIDKMYDTYSLKEHEKWVEDAVILGSLTTTKWLLSSDLDVHIRVNLDAFIETNMPGSSKEEAFAKLDEIRKEFDRAKILLPMTNHPAEFYFESVDLQPSNVDMVGVYSLMQDKWLKDPILFEAGLDLEESKKSVVEAAEAIAQELDSSIGTIKRDIQRVNELETVIQAWDKDKQQLFYNKIETKLNNIEEEIKKDIEIKQDLVDARHENMSATSDNELTFKWLQRFGFFGILSQLKKLLEQTDGKITTEDLPLIEKVISEASLEVSADRGMSAWIDPSGKVFYLSESNAGTHAEWIGAHPEEWFKKIGINLKDYYDEDRPEDEQDWGEIEEALQYDLIGKGWTRVGDISGGSGEGFQVADLYNLPNYLFDYFARLNRFGQAGKIVIEDVDNRWIEIDSDDAALGQKAVNRALSHKRLQTASVNKFAAFMKKANTSEEDFQEAMKTILVDMDDTICHETPDHKCGEPMEGVKEALGKLKEMGYEIEIFSHRADTEEGMDNIKEWLDKNEMPYDSIFQGIKPLAFRYIDDRAIKFTNWNQVLEEVENAQSI